MGWEIDTVAMTISLPAEKLTQLHNLLAAWPAERTVATTESEFRTLIRKLLHGCGVVRPGKYFVRRMLLAVGLDQIEPGTGKTRSVGKFANEACSPHSGVSCGCRVLGVECRPRARLNRGKVRRFLAQILSPAALAHTGIRRPRHRHGQVLLGIGPVVAGGFGRRGARTPESAQAGSG